ncbi:STAS domain-containing protein [Chroococcus sp. FPU101]|uniref:STAS domain-containing protein n=1 Tax=Chroococcus sp. FPU101 TaxID=1974212 RepID=UPI001A8D5028|nr:STAS domain-containing protein [Chroococcus sp. FPU101]GFE68960.1 anti-sigma-factor antagonist [Chroococcus sp. FPU101]
MSVRGNSQIVEIVKNDEAKLLTDWLNVLLSGGVRQDLIKESQLRKECQEFLELFKEALEQGDSSNIHASNWSEVRETLAKLSRNRSQKGFTPSETANFIFSLKQPLFERLRQENTQDSSTRFEEIWQVTTLLDQLGLWTTEIYLKSREEVILRQQEELLELSTPVVQLWDGILALPIIGTLDSNRTQTMMESLLQEIVETKAELAIIDITGVPTVDTLTAQHLLKTVTAARLMGAECIISGIRPQIAQTIVYLGVDLSDVVTKASLADAFALALKHLGLKITKREPHRFEIDERL